jgi:glutamate transport system permease protein
VDFLSNYDLLGAFWVTVQLTFWSAIGALVWGVVLAGMRVSPVWLMRAFATAYVNVVRNTPLTLLVVAASLGLYQTLGVSLTTDTTTSAIDITNFRLSVLAFILYTGTFVSEAVRSGINTVPVGQAEASRALGLGFMQTLTIVVLPQALRSVVAPLASVLIALTKNTTIASAIGVAEAAVLMKTMIENEGQAGSLVFVVFAIGFVILTLPVGLLLGWLSQKVAVKR